MAERAPVAAAHGGAGSRERDTTRTGRLEERKGEAGWDEGAMEERNHAEAGSSAVGINGGRDWSARSTPESEEGRVERRVSDRAARALC